MRETEAKRARSPLLPALVLFLFAAGSASPETARTGGYAHPQGETAGPPGQAEEQAPAWKCKYLAIVLQNSGAHRLNAPVFVEIINRLVASKPPSVAVALFAFADGFKQLEEARFRRSVTTVLPATTSADELRDAARELVYGGPSPIYDAVRAAVDAAGKAQPAAVLLISNGVDNASDISFEEITRHVEKAGVPVIAFYFPTGAPMGGDGHMKKLAKASGGRFVDLRAKDSWDQLLAAFR